MSDSSTIHVPLEPKVRKQFTLKAKQLGFDSAQAYLRVLIKAVVDDRRIDLDIDKWGEPSDVAAKRLNQAAEDAKNGIGLSKAFNNADDLVQDLLA